MHTISTNGSTTTAMTTLDITPIATSPPPTHQRGGNEWIPGQETEMRDPAAPDPGTRDA